MYCGNTSKGLHGTSDVRSYAVATYGFAVYSTAVVVRFLAYRVVYRSLFSLHLSFKTVCEVSQRELPTPGAPEILDAPVPLRGLRRAH